MNETQRNLYLVQDRDRPMYVLAETYQKALENWQFFIAVENEDDEISQPEGISLVAHGEDVIDIDLLEVSFGPNATINSFLGDYDADIDKRQGRVAELVKAGFVRGI